MIKRVGGMEMMKFLHGEPMAKKISTRYGNMQIY